MAFIEKYNGMLMLAHILVGVVSDELKIAVGTRYRNSS